MDQVHEFMFVAFRPGIEGDEQAAVMAALDAHLARCEGLLSRGYYRDKDGRWVKHLVWASADHVEASTSLEDDPVVAGLFACFDTEEVAYACCERFEPGGLASSADGVAPL